jgi:colanic acid/amylovoran biosynthesis glycosyltransferase
MSVHEPLPALSTRATRLRVAHSFPVWLPTTQNWIQTVVETLPPEVESHVVCERTTERREASARIHVSGRGLLTRLLPRGRGLWHRRFLTSRLRALRADVLHSHFGDVGWHDRTSARAAGVRHVISFYGYDAGALPHRAGWGERLRDLFQGAHAVVVQGPRFADRLRELGCPERVLRVVPLGLDLPRWPFAPRETAGSPLRILIAGSFREKKGIPDAIRAAARVGEDLSVEITLVGGAPPDAAGRVEERRIASTIDTLGLRARVRRLGPLPHGALATEARGHDVFVCASRTAADGDTEGGLPVTLLEMAAMGVAIVATRHADIPELVEHAATGRLVEEGDVDGLAREIKWLAEHPAERLSIVTRARRRIEGQFDARAHGRTLAQVYAG